MKLTPHLILTEPLKVLCIHYKCEQCGAEDSVKLFEGEHVPPAFNCYNCKAGYGVELAEMLHKRVGMFPVLATRKAA